MPDIAGWFYNRDAEPDFKHIVDKSLGLFTTFAGVGFSFYVKDFLFDNKMEGFKNFPFWNRAFIAVALIALLLRYVVGSAVHLNSRYVPKVTQHVEEIAEADRRGNAQIRLRMGETKELVYTSLGLLYCDIAFLVFFGVLAIAIAYSHDLPDFMWRSVYFILAGFAWGVVAAAVRPIDRAVALRWMAIDIGQLIVTFALIRWHDTFGIDFTTAALAAVYAFCLFVDFAVVSRPKS